MSNMIQSHIINLPKPWKVFFDCYGHLHLHAASMICIEERSAKSDKKYNRRFGTALNGDRIDSIPLYQRFKYIHPNGKPRN